VVLVQIAPNFELELKVWPRDWQALKIDRLDAHRQLLARFDRLGWADGSARRPADRHVLLVHVGLCKNAQADGDRLLVGPVHEVAGGHEHCTAVEGEARVVRPSRRGIAEAGAVSFGNDVGDGLG
jgi:hypothetical protein